MNPHFRVGTASCYKKLVAGRASRTSITPTRAYSRQKFNLDGAVEELCAGVYAIECVRVSPCANEHHDDHEHPAAI